MAVVWIAGWPHCGSTLLRTFLRDTFGCKCWSTYPEPKLQFAFGPESDEWAREYTADPVAAVARLEEADECYAIKTHEWPTDARPVIYIARDGRDAIVSLSRFWSVPVASLLGDVEVRVDTWLGSMLHHQKRLRFGSWSSNFLAWDAENRPNGHLLRFSEILEVPGLVASRLGQFLQRKTTGRWVDRFEEYQAKWPALYDDKDDEHRHSMTPQEEAMFWRLHGHTMRYLGFGEGE